jgi:glycosyltransferase involved in cell wall biosynthesis
LPANLHVVNPWMWPSFRTRLARMVNRELLLRQLRLLPAPPIAVTTVPIVADLVGLLPVQRWVYYCVDDFGSWPGLDQVPLRQMEEKLVRRVDRVIAVSTTLQERLANLGRVAPLLTHGVDREHWSAPSPDLPLLDGLERPLIVFWGVKDRRMDVAFVRRLGADLTRGTIVLVGPENGPDAAVLSLPRVRSMPAIAWEQLPTLARAAAVLIMPYADLAVTRAMQPLKLKEYLATGRPVVVRDLPATRDWADCLDLALDAETFSRLVRQRLATGTPEDQQLARRRLAGEGWGEKARQLERWLLDSEEGSSWANASSLAALSS